MKLTHEAIDVCSEAHQRDPRNANILRDRAEAFILNQEYEKGEEPGHVSGGPYCDGIDVWGNLWENPVAVSF